MSWWFCSFIVHDPVWTLIHFHITLTTFIIKYIQNRWHLPIHLEQTRVHILTITSAVGSIFVQYFLMTLTRALLKNNFPSSINHSCSVPSREPYIHNNNNTFVLKIYVILINVLYGTYDIQSVTNPFTLFTK